MIKPFKFLSKQNFQFKYEFLIDFRNHCNVREIYSTTRSQQIRSWLSEYYFNKPLGSPYYEYLGVIDRYCELLECGVQNYSGVYCFDAMVKISKSEDEYTILVLRYPINEIIDSNAV